MAIQITPKDIEDIVKQIDNLQQLAKAGAEKAEKQAGSLTPQEQEQLNLFEEYLRTKKELKDAERLFLVGGSGTSKLRYMIKLYKTKLGGIEPLYNAVLSKKLKQKKDSIQQKYNQALKIYFYENIKPLWEELNIFLFAREEPLYRIDPQIVNQIIELFDFEKAFVASDQQFEDVTLKLQKIRARLVVERQQKPATQKPAGKGWNNTPSKGSRIGAWLWKLYEKSLKVIVDAFLERVWPKG